MICEFTPGSGIGAALGLADLQPGQTYREKVNGCTVEVRVLNDATPELAQHGMLQPWVEFPFRSLATVAAELGRPQLPKPFVLDESDLAPE